MEPFIDDPPDAPAVPDILDSVITLRELASFAARPAHAWLEPHLYTIIHILVGRIARDAVRREAARLRHAFMENG